MRCEEIAYIDQYHQIHYVDVGRYPDGSPMVKHQRTSCPVRVMLRPRDSIGFLGGIFWVQSLIEQGVRPPELVVPCVFGQRQDRINPQGDTLFTAKSVGKLINSLGCPRVTILDPHSEVSSTAIDRCNVVHVDDILNERSRSFMPQTLFGLKKYAAVISPDAGAVKRAERIAKMLKIPLKIAGKTRDVTDGKITGFHVEDCSDLFQVGSPAGSNVDVPHVLVIDDLCDGGGTFIGLGQVLDAEGFDADLYVTHGLFTKGTQDLFTWYQRIFCTDSVVVERLDVNILKICEFILQHGDIP